jgi:hypothetical protein
MLSQTNDLSQSQSKELPDLQSTSKVAISDSTNESFISDSRKAGPSNKEKDLSDWTSRISVEEWGLLI